MGIGQNVQPFQIAMLIDRNLNSAEKFRHVLNFVNNKRRRMLATESRSVFYGLTTDVRVFKIHIGIIREAHSHQCGLARLTGAKDRNHGKPLG